MDKADIAQELIEWKLEQVMNARRQAQSPTALASRATCKECDDPIPAERRKAIPGVQFCVACQTYLEGR
jgi:phage/conjugal plasmid C-4 type zinc finger TraR family protein